MDFLEPSTPIDEVVYGGAFPYIKLASNGIIEFHEWDYEKAEPKPEKHKGSYMVKGDQLVITCNHKYMDGTYTIEKATKTKLYLLKKTAEYTIKVQWGKSYYKM